MFVFFLMSNNLILHGNRGRREREATLEGKLCCNNRRYTVRDRAVLMKEHTFVSAQLYLVD